MEWENPTTGKRPKVAEFGVARGMRGRPILPRTRIQQVRPAEKPAAAKIDLPTKGSDDCRVTPQVGDDPLRGKARRGQAQAPDDGEVPA